MSNVLPESSISLFDTLSLDYLKGRQLFHQRYGSGLRFLISRKCCGTEYDMYFEWIVEASLTAISSGVVTNDAEIPALVRKVFHKVTAVISEASKARALQTLRDKMQFDQTTINFIQERLALFSAIQREALYRFYVREESATAICHDLKLFPEQFDFLRNVIRSVVRLEMDFAFLRRPAQSLSVGFRGVAI